MALMMDGGDGDSGIWTTGFFARGGARCVHRSPLQRSATVGTKASVMHQPRGAERPTQGRPSEVQGPTWGCHPRVERGVLLQGGGQRSSWDFGGVAREVQGAGAAAGSGESRESGSQIGVGCGARGR